MYLALDGGEGNLKAKSNQTNDKLSGFVKTTEGRLAVYLIREFLVFFGLNYTLSVFDPEVIEGREPLSSSLPSRSRLEMIERLGLASEMLNENAPLISEIVRLSKVSVLKSETPSPTEFLEDSSLRTSIDTHNPSAAVNNAPQTTTKVPATEASSAESSFNAFGSLERRTEAQTSKPAPSSEQLEKKPNEPPPKFLSDLPPLGASSASRSLAPIKKTPKKEESLGTLQSQLI